MRVGSKTTANAGWITFTEEELNKGLKLDKNFAGEHYEQERKILQEACRDVESLRAEIIQASQYCILGRSIILLILEFWALDFPTQLFRVLRRLYGR